MKSEKDKTLNEIISYCEKKMTDIGHDIDIYIEHCGVGDAVYSQLRGQVDTYKDIAGKCHRLLFRSGSMPLEGENQSEDADVR